MSFKDFQVRRVGTEIRFYKLTTELRAPELMKSLTAHYFVTFYIIVWEDGYMGQVQGVCLPLSTKHYIQAVIDDHSYKR